MNARQHEVLNRLEGIVERTTNRVFVHERDRRYHLQDRQAALRLVLKHAEEAQDAIYADALKALEHKLRYEQPKPKEETVPRAVPAPEPPKVKREKRRWFSAKTVLTNAIAIIGLFAPTAYHPKPAAETVIELPPIVANAILPRQASDLEAFVKQGDCAYYPVQDQEKLVTGYPGKRDGRDHGNSYDLRARAGKKITAMCDGIVTSQGVNKQGYSYLTIDTQRGFEIQMLHVKSLVAVGDTIYAGDPVANVSATDKDHQSGKYLPPHLHTTVTITDSNNTIRYPKALAGLDVPLPCILKKDILDDLVRTSAGFTADSTSYTVPSGLRYDQNGVRVRSTKQIRESASHLVPSLINDQCSSYARTVVSAQTTYPGANAQ